MQDPDTPGADAPEPPADQPSRGAETDRELPESRLYTFIDGRREYALYFLEGQRLIRDLALIHDVRGAGFAYFRDVVLSVQPIIAFLKQGEQIGFYIDSEEPYFRLKIETGHHGATRCTLLPENFHEFPETMRGLVRVQKLFPRNQPPYQSVLQVDRLPLREIVNRVLTTSYQVNCAMMVSKASDQSVLLHQLPPMPGQDDSGYTPQTVRARREGEREAIESIFGRALHGAERIESAFSEIGFRLLASRAVRFQCSCSRQRMVQNVEKVYRSEGEALFEPGSAHLTIVCEYCKSRYTIMRDDLGGSPDLPN